MDKEILNKINDATPPDEELDSVADFFKMFGDNTRLKIMLALQQSELCVMDISEALSMTQSAISHQLKVLKQQDLVKARRDGKTIFYSLADDHIATILSTGIDHIEE
jgi:ArsR family transcriptional regulator